MSLPKITNITTKCFLPVYNKEVEYRAFTLGEETNILLAQDAGTEEEITHAILKIMQNCVIDETIDILKLSITDLIILFINIVDISKGAKREVIYKCKNIIDNVECVGEMTAELDMKKAIQNYEQYKYYDLVKLNDNITIKMNIPSYIDIMSANKKSEMDALLELYAKCILEIYEGEDNVYNDFTIDEMIEWIKQLPVEYIKNINKFFEEIPEIKLVINLKCPKCGEEHTITYNGLDGFFLLHSTE